MSHNETKKFSLGRIVATPGALHALHEAGQSADELTKVLEQEEQYWIKTKLDDAIALAKTNRSDAQQLATDAKAGKIDDAKTVYKQLEKTCTDCHGLHPEQRVKPE